MYRRHLTGVLISPAACLPYAVRIFFFVSDFSVLGPYNVELFQSCFIPIPRRQIYVTADKPSQQSENR